MTMPFHVFHERQASGEYVATCQTLPGWFSFGDTLDESYERAEWSLRDHLVDHVVRLCHFEVPAVNTTLRQAA